MYLLSFMVSNIFHKILFLSISYLNIHFSTASNSKPQSYVVYMGSSSGGNGQLGESDHMELLSSVIPSEQKERISIMNTYNHAFTGFSAILTENEAAVLSGREEIVSVFPDSLLNLHTTRSWDFLEEKSGLISTHLDPHASSDVIIGVIDTGIWSESPSFNDDGIGEIPKKWKGVCMEGWDFKKSNCNRKLIGARYYNVKNNLVQPNKNNRIDHRNSPRDNIGHGTHTASIAAGAPVENASYFGLARGTARGGSASSRIAAYKACSDSGCSGSTILKAIDDAIKDGVDIISISIGLNSVFGYDFLRDPIAIGAFHAEQHGVMVVCSAGNDGPVPYTVVNNAPWIVTVAASSIDRDFKATVLLGNGKSFNGSAINFSNLTRSKTYPITLAENAAAKFTPLSDASNCRPGTLDSKKVAGKIVVCTDNDPTISRRIKQLVVQDSKAKGIILIEEDKKDAILDSGSYPFAELAPAQGSQILNYINSTEKPTATILQTTEVQRSKPAPVVAYFSSRGPNMLTENILKPDLMAPGVAILAAFIPKKDVEIAVPTGRKPSLFSIRSGTSMACPHVSGAAAFIKSVHHGWSSPMIRSALMTTATVSNNLGNDLTNSSDYIANPHEMGAGEISPLNALDPGLVFETTTQDYLLYHCYSGYPEKKIRAMTDTNFRCPKNSAQKLISNINYPSISIENLSRQGIRKIKRTVTNVGSPNATYLSSVQAPTGLIVEVSPKQIAFEKDLEKTSFQVSFCGKKAPSGYNFGAITWNDGAHNVRIAFAVNVV